jgi:hypothetical protein
MEEKLATDGEGKIGHRWRRENSPRIEKREFATDREERIRHRWTQMNTDKKRMA